MVVVVSIYFGEGKVTAKFTERYTEFGRVHDDNIIIDQV